MSRRCPSSSVVMTDCGLNDKSESLGFRFCKVCSISFPHVHAHTLSHVTRDHNFYITHTHTHTHTQPSGSGHHTQTKQQNTHYNPEQAWIYKPHTTTAHILYTHYT